MRPEIHLTQRAEEGGSQETKTTSMAQTAIYFAILDPEKSPGVANKIEHTLLALETHEYKTSQVLVSPATRGRHLAFIRSVAAARSDLCIIRNSLFSMVLLAPILFMKRLSGARVVIDVPTPCITATEEMAMPSLSFLGRLARTLGVYLNFPWGLWPAHRVLQYSEESKWFSLGNRRRTKLVANGIAVAQIAQRSGVPSWPSGTFVLIGVASLAPWHGFDRVIRAIALHRRENPMENRPKVRFLVVGHGRVRGELEQLAHELKVDDAIDFMGLLTGKDLDDVFERGHVAVSSLGMFRNDLITTSVLKAREYVARGIPLVQASQDPDFEPLPSFVYRAPNTDTPLDLDDLLDWYTKFCEINLCPADIRQYAAERLDYQAKVGDYLE